jgi:hypothetical protein
VRHNEYSIARIFPVGYRWWVYWNGELALSGFSATSKRAQETCLEALRDLQRTFEDAPDPVPPRDAEARSVPEAERKLVVAGIGAILDEVREMRDELREDERAWRDPSPDYDPVIARARADDAKFYADRLTGLLAKCEGVNG